MTQTEIARFEREARLRQAHWRELLEQPDRERKKRRRGRIPVHLRPWKQPAA